MVPQAKGSSGEERGHVSRENGRILWATPSLYALRPPEGVFSVAFYKKPPKTAFGGRILNLINSQRNKFDIYLIV